MKNPEAGRDISRDEMLTFIENTLKEKGSKFEAAFNERLAEISPELPATKGKDHQSPAMHTVKQKYELLQEMLAEEEDKAKNEDMKQAA
jgi:hypothetical protein